MTTLSRSPARRAARGSSPVAGTARLVLLLALAAGIARGGSAMDERTLRVRWTRAGVVGIPALTEASGLAASRTAPGLLHAHNDSGHWPVIHVFDRTGSPRVSARLPAFPLDWEDLAAARVDGRPVLLVADTGDNFHARERALLFLFGEPDLRADPHEPAEATEVTAHPGRRSLPPPRLLATLGVTYPGGPVDVEAAAIDAAARRVLLVERAAPGAVARVFAVPLPELPGPGPAEEDGRGEGESGPRAILEPPTLEAEAVPVQRLRLPPLTGMDIGPDGRRCVCVSLREGFLFTRAAGEGWETALGRAPERFALPELPQIEAVCFDAEGRAVYVMSETRGGEPPELWRGALVGERE
jgi:hypothetical protein